MNITYYREINGEIDLFKCCYQQQLPLLIKGPTGCGKTQYVTAMAEYLQRPLIKVLCNEDTTAGDLLGRFLLKNQETIWQDGPVTRAVREGAILYLDEIAEAREDVIVALHPLTDHRREIYIDKINETIRAPSNFFCVASYNPGYQRGIRDLKPSTRQRFVSISFSYPSIDVESEIVIQLTGIPIRYVTCLVKMASAIRSQAELGLRETVSTRLLVNAALLIKAGMDPRDAAYMAIAEALTDDKRTLDSLKQLISFSF
ncbi:MAG: CbbQ/NirQ/NorQ/GpvN family protein [Deltaproteobacteria bacterium]|nr:MAG: CbbQ/NirQ/NorQ/GpvN family protein [Deltaproteobacteria bacterium]